jgi:hypothetical protein
LSSSIAKAFLRWKSAAQEKKSAQKKKFRAEDLFRSNRF